MYDLHSHLLPGMDDGAPDEQTALAMARRAVEDGITHLACTPHVYPGLYDYDAWQITAAVEAFADRLEQERIPLTLAAGADIQVQPETIQGLRDGVLPTINGSRYFLFEPPHHVPMARFVDQVGSAVAAGFVPVITHPERLAWLDDHYDEFAEAVSAGAWLQLTAGSLTGRFGQQARQRCRRLLGDGLVHLLATDAHDLRMRAPLLAEGAEQAAAWVGEEQARDLVMTRPRGVWENLSPESLPEPLIFEEGLAPERGMGLFRRWFRG